MAMGVSRPTLCRILGEARSRVARALSRGWAIRIETDLPEIASPNITTVPCADPAEAGAASRDTIMEVYHARTRTRRRRQGTGRGQGMGGGQGRGQGSGRGGCRGQRAGAGGAVPGGGAGLGRDPARRIMSDGPEFR